MRCPDCAAHNPDTAHWCTLCYAVFAQPAPSSANSSGNSPAPGSHDRVEQTSDAPPGVPWAGGAPVSRSAERANGMLAQAVRQDDGQVVWPCPACGQFVDIEHTTCNVCGTPVLAQLQSRRDADPTARVAPATGLALSAVLPGAGHIAWQRYGTGIARALLYVLWLLGGIVLAAAYAPDSLLVAAPLLLGALTLWVGSLIDVLSLSGQGRQFVEGRMLLWLVVGVTGLTLLGAVATVGTFGSLS